MSELGNADMEHFKLKIIFRSSYLHRRDRPPKIIGLARLLENEDQITLDIRRHSVQPAHVLQKPKNAPAT